MPEWLAGDQDPQREDAINALAIGEVSGLLDMAKGFVILKRLAPGGP